MPAETMPPTRADRRRWLLGAAVLAGSAAVPQARLLAQQGLRVVVALIAPYAAERQAALARIGHCLEVHVDAPAAVRQARDPKGHYARAQQGLLPQFTGVGAPYEAPERPALRIDTSACTPEEAVAQLLALLPP